MEHPDTPEQYAEGARLARNNASAWLDDAECLANRSPDSHALAAAIMGCEESSKAYTWIMCSWMDHSDAVAFEDVIRKRSDRHYLQMFLAVFIGSISPHVLSSRSSSNRTAHDFPSDPMQQGFRALGEVVRELPDKLSALFRSIPRLGDIRGSAFYVDWKQAEHGFRTPSDSSPGDASTYIGAGRGLIKLLDYILPRWDEASLEQREQMGAAWKPVVRMLTSKDVTALEPILTELGAGVAGSRLLPGTPSSAP